MQFPKFCPFYFIEIYKSIELFSKFRSFKQGLPNIFEIFEMQNSIFDIRIFDRSNI